MTKAEREQLRKLVDGWEDTRSHYDRVHAADERDLWSGGVADGLDMAIEELRELLGDDTEHKR